MLVDTYSIAVLIASIRDSSTYHQQKNGWKTLQDHICSKTAVHVVITFVDRAPLDCGRFSSRGVRRLLVCWLFVLPRVRLQRPPWEFNLAPRRRHWEITHHPAIHDIPAEDNNGTFGGHWWTTVVPTGQDPSFMLVMA